MWSNLCRKNPTKFLIRVDDFPRGDLTFDDYQRFHKVMSDYDCPYLLGVTPFLPEGISKEEIDFLKSHKDHNVELSLHGFTHEKIGQGRYQGEIDCYTDEELKILVDRSKEFFFSNSIEFPDSFIPPFNTLTKGSFLGLSVFFKYVMGGPLSIQTLGSYRFLDKLENSFYIPSYFPFYGRAEEITKGIGFLSPHSDTVMVVTIHWAWEITDNFTGLKKFLSRYGSQIVDYSAAKESWHK